MLGTGWMHKGQEHQRGQGTAAALALSLILVLGVSAMLMASPDLGSDSQTQDLNTEAEATVSGMETILNETQYRLLSQSWTQNTAPGPIPHDRESKYLFGDDWSQLNGMTQYELGESLGSYLAKTKATQAQRGKITDIKPVTVHSGPFITYIGFFSQQASGEELELATNVKEFYHAEMSINRTHLNESKSDALSLVVDDGTDEWKAHIWNDSNDIQVEIDGTTYGYSAQEIRFNLTAGEINGNSIPEKIGEGVSGPAEVRLENVHMEWGGINMWVNGSSSIQPADNDPTIDWDEKARSVDLIKRGVFDVLYQNSGDTNARRLNYSGSAQDLYELPSPSIGPAPEPQFDVEILNHNSYIDWDSDTLPVEMKVKVTNTGRLEDTQDIKLFDSQNKVPPADATKEDLYLDRGQSDTFTLKTTTGGKMFSSQKYSVWSLDDHEVVTVYGPSKSLIAAKTKFVFQPKIPGSIEEGDTVTYVLKLKNTASGAVELLGTSEYIVDPDGEITATPTSLTALGVESDKQVQVIWRMSEHHWNPDKYEKDWHAPYMAKHVITWRVIAVLDTSDDSSSSTTDG